MRTARRNARHGSSAIEFALLLPLLLALLFGIIEFGWLFQRQSSLVSAVREGARAGVTYALDDTPNPLDAADARVRSALTAYGFDPAAATIVTAYEGTSPEERLNVSCTLPYTPLIGFGAVAPATLSSRMTMLLEVQE